MFLATKKSSYSLHLLSMICFFFLFSSSLRLDQRQGTWKTCCAATLLACIDVGVMRSAKTLSPNRTSLLVTLKPLDTFFFYLLGTQTLCLTVATRTFDVPSCFSFVRPGRAGFLLRPAIFRVCLPVQVFSFFSFSTVFVLY